MSRKKTKKRPTRDRLGARKQAQIRRTWLRVGTDRGTARETDVSAKTVKRYREKAEKAGKPWEKAAERIEQKVAALQEEDEIQERVSLMDQVDRAIVAQVRGIERAEPGTIPQRGRAMADLAKTKQLLGGGVTEKVELTLKERIESAYEEEEGRKRERGKRRAQIRKRLGSGGAGAAAAG